MQTALMIRHFGHRAIVIDRVKTRDAIAAPHKQCSCTKDAGNDLRLPDHRLSRRFLNQQTSPHTPLEINVFSRRAAHQKTVDRAFVAYTSLAAINEFNHRMCQRSN